MSRINQKRVPLLKLAGAAAAVLLFLLAGHLTLQANSYTYTVTISGGNQGSFSGTEGISVDNSATGSAYSIALTDNTVQITGLKYGDIVSCDAQYAVSVSDDSKYYVMGIRQSGRDNNTVADSAFTVTKDVDYVVAYGIPAELTQYTVYYLDEEGEELAEARTYYGNVGDEPVIAYLYIEGYVPATYNETKELVADSSQNIFAFVYMYGTNSSENVEGTESVGGTEDGTEIVIVETEYIENTEYVTVDPNGGNGDDTNGGGNGDDTNGGGDGSESEDDSKTLSIINDVLVPLANLVGETIQKMIEDGTLIPTAVGLAALIALIVLLILFLKRRKKDEDEDGEAPELEAAEAGEAAETEEEE